MTSLSPGSDDLLPSGGEPNSRREGSSSALPEGFQLAEFQIERVLGEGGFGIVYQARDLQLGRQVAIKEYMPNSLAGRQRDLHVTVRTDRHRETFELGRRSFINEARLLAHFDHPALVKVLRFWEERGTAYMAMPFYQASTLKDVLRGIPPYPSEAWLRSLWDPLLDALAHLHTENCFHRDIAPDNILVLPSGLPLLIDFGAARQVIGDATQALTVILKPGFAPVEQYAESASMKQGPWTDIYALAAVMFHAISGKAPPPSVARLVHDEMPAAAQIGAGRYSAPFLQCIDACLAVRPEHRPQSIAAVRALLQAAVPMAPAWTPPQGDLPGDLETTIGLPAAAGAGAIGPSQAILHAAATRPHADWPMPADADDAMVHRTGPPPPSPEARATPAAPVAHVPPAAGHAPRAAAPQARSVPSSPRHATTKERSFRPPPAPARNPMGKVLAVLAGAGVLAVGGWWGMSQFGGTRPVSAAIQARAVDVLGLDAPGAGRASAVPAPVQPEAVVRSAAVESSAPASTPLADHRNPSGLLPQAADAYAAFERIVASRDAAWPMQARLGKPTVTQGQGVQLSVDSSVGGYVYVLQALPGSTRVELLFPNRADTRNRIEPGASLALPRKGWRWPVGAPLGERRALVVVTRSERRFSEAMENTNGLTPAGFDVSALPADPARWPGVPDCPASDLACGGRYGATLLDFSVAAAPRQRVEAEPELEKIIIRRAGEAGPDDIPTPALSGHYPQSANVPAPEDKPSTPAAGAIVERIIDTPPRMLPSESRNDKPSDSTLPQARRMDECAELIRRAHSGGEGASAAQEQLKDLRCE